MTRLKENQEVDTFAAIAVRLDFVNGGYENGERDNTLYLSSNQVRE